MYLWLILLVFLTIKCSPGDAKCHTISFDQANIVSPKYVEGSYRVTESRVNKFNRTTYVWNFAFETFVNLDFRSYIELQFHYKQLNNEYEITPYSIKNMTMPAFSIKYYRLLFMKQFEGCSNFPQFGLTELTHTWPKVNFSFIWKPNFE